jgi:hypothetical protein
VFIQDVGASEAAQAGDPQALWRIYKSRGGGFFPFGIKSYRLAALADRQEHVVPRLLLRIARVAWRYFNYVPWVSAVLILMSHLPVALDQAQRTALALTGCLLMFGMIVIAMEGLLATRCLGAWASLYHRFPRSGEPPGRARAAEYYLLVGGSIFAVVASAASIDFVAERFNGFDGLNPGSAVAALIGLSFQAGFTGLLTFSGPDPKHGFGYVVHDLGILLSIAYVGVLLQIILEQNDAPPARATGVQAEVPTVTARSSATTLADPPAPRSRRWVAAVAVGVYVVAQIIEHHGVVLRP